MKRGTKSIKMTAVQIFFMYFGLRSPVQQTFYEKPASSYSNLIIIAS